VQSDRGGDHLDAQALAYDEARRIAANIAKLYDEVAGAERRRAVADGDPQAAGITMRCRSLRPFRHVVVAGCAGTCAIWSAWRR